MIEYYKLGARKRLNQIVMAGSHDAGITRGGANAKTQGLNIFGQATEGVRIFDLRVTGVASKSNGVKQVQLQTYHGPLNKKAVQKPVAGLANQRDIIQTKVTGTFGEGLNEILNDTIMFLSRSNEFLILKFDKCINWEAIAELVVQELAKANVLYTDVGNINTRTLDELKGKAIVLFTSEGLNQIDQSFRGRGGIHGIKNLGSGKPYDPDFDGIQYWGKGGTSLMNPASKSFDENYATQLGLMKAGAASGNPDVMGMMYWTTTGLVGNIEDRNNRMWKSKRVDQLEELWKLGLGQAAFDRLPAGVNPKSSGARLYVRQFLPNFVMVDFADKHKCQTIFKFNELDPLKLMELANS